MNASDPQRRTFLSLLILTLFAVAPLAGVALKGGSPLNYLGFPPMTTRVESASFSWLVFIAVILFVVITTFPFWRRMTVVSLQIKNPGADHRQRFPWWGWLSAAGILLFWVLAWTRFSWFEPYQRYTFFPLWFSLILFLNAMAVSICRRSLMTHQSLYFTLLFPASALFWWVFEYLNRFVNNWHYLGTSGIGGWQYFWEASLAFSTVLPAVLSVRFLLMQTNIFTENYRNFPAMPWLTSGLLWTVTGVACLFALVAVGWIPHLTYPLIWIVPGLIWVVYQRWNGYENPLLQEASRGDLTLVWSSACAALLCGFFWELWNFYSLAKWVYNVPGLDHFHLFEMPIAGYAGYLPFGVICALVSNSLYTSLEHNR